MSSQGSIVMVVWLSLAAIVIPKAFPRPRQRWRILVVALVLALSCRYFFWRGSATLNGHNPISLAVSLLVLAVELFDGGAGMLELWFSLSATDRSPQADRAAAALASDRAAGLPLPIVDVLIPTFNEPVAVLKRTIAGCLALDYPRFRVYLLDDGQRSAVRDLAMDWGCGYLTRADRRHAKAGNLNHALGQIDGDLVACFDADFVPTHDFLQRTVGLFREAQVGLVQTHQNFYNPDPIVSNLDLVAGLTTSRELFTRYIEPCRDGSASTICYGSSFVVRRQALDRVGGFVVESLAEDYATGLALSAAGYEVLYLDEDLSAGLSAESLDGYVAQQQRWAIGSLQVLFLGLNPLIVPGLRLRQRLAHLHGLLYWFSPWSRLLLVLLWFSWPVLGILPIVATWQDWLGFFLPYMLVKLGTHGWLTRRACASFVGRVYEWVNCLPIAITVAQVIVRPFGRPFRVTPKGVARDRGRFHRLPGLPLAAIALSFFLILIWLQGQASALQSDQPIGLWQWGQASSQDIYRQLLPTVLGGQGNPSASGLADRQANLAGLYEVWWQGWWRVTLVGLVVELVFLVAAIVACFDRPKPEPVQWFVLARSIRLGYDPHQANHREPRSAQNRPRLPSTGVNTPVQAIDHQAIEPISTIDPWSEPAGIPQGLVTRSRQIPGAKEGPIDPVISGFLTDLPLTEIPNCGPGTTHPWPGLAFSSCELVSDWGIEIPRQAIDQASGLGPLPLGIGDRVWVAIDDDHWPEGLVLPAEVRPGSGDTWELRWQDWSSDQERQWLAWLYGTPGRWLRRQAPGELRSLLMILAGILKAPYHQTFDRRRSAIKLG